jgi:uncharacterized small protein (DUF1192 family)
MDLDDLEPRNRPTPKKNLDVMSVDELEDYVAALQAEIARTRDEIEKKRAHLSGADALFKSK